MHVYTGTLGSHVALVFRRLIRILDRIKVPVPQFIACSATIANPSSHMCHLLNIDASNLVTVTEDGAACAEKEFFLWDPKLVSTAFPSAHEENIPALSSTPPQQTFSPTPFHNGWSAPSSRNIAVDAARLMTHFVMNKKRTIMFCKTRETCEIALQLVRSMLDDHSAFSLAPLVSSYRGGYRASSRRYFVSSFHSSILETDLFTGKMIGVVTTSALELGVDIGDLEVTIHVGFPGSITSLWQQAGRAGRQSLIATP